MYWFQACSYFFECIFHGESKYCYEIPEIWHFWHFCDIFERSYAHACRVVSVNRSLLLSDISPVISDWLLAWLWGYIVSCGDKRYGVRLFRDRRSIVILYHSFVLTQEITVNIFNAWADDRYIYKHLNNFQNGQLFGISWPYLESPLEIHSKCTNMPSIRLLFPTFEKVNRLLLRPNQCPR